MPEISPLDVFFRGKGIFVFLPGAGGQYRACNVYAYLQKIPYFHAFFDKNLLLSFSAQKKNIIFSGKNKYYLSRYYKKDRVQARISWKDHLSRTPEESIIFRGIFLRKIIFRFVSKNKIIFSGKRNIIFPDNTRKIILQCDFFGKTMFSKHLEKENMVFRALLFKSLLSFKFIKLDILDKKENTFLTFFTQTKEIHFKF